MRRNLAAATAVLLLATVAACGGDGDGGGRTLTVYAAASLALPFEELGERFEAEHDGVEVTFSFAGSSDLAAQVRQGAGADVFASADEATMASLTEEDLVDAPVPFATNTLQLAVPPDDPAGIGSLQDLAEPGVRLVVCAPAVPCGAAAVAVEEAAGLDLRPVSEEQSVTDVLNKVISGEADAGLVYVTDVQGAGDRVRGIDVPEAEDVVNTYPIATVADSDHAEPAQEFVALVTGEVGQQVLREAGFGAP